VSASDPGSGEASPAPGTSVGVPGEDDGTSAGRRVEASWRAPESLRARIAQALDETAQGRSEAEPPAASAASRSGWVRLVRRWNLLPSLAVLAISTFLVLMPAKQGAAVQEEIVSSHVRSLLDHHLIDITSDDLDTLTSWFNGKIEFSPPVLDLAGRGFVLLGGRIDYISGHVVAAIVYRRNGHIINVFVLPSGRPLSSAGAKDGYNLVNWTQGALVFSAISDLNAAELGIVRSSFLELPPR